MMKPRSVSTPYSTTSAFFFHPVFFSWRKGQLLIDFVVFNIIVICNVVISLGVNVDTVFIFRQRLR